MITNATTRVVNGYTITLTHDGWVVDLGGSNTITFPGSSNGFANAATLARRLDEMSPE